MSTQRSNTGHAQLTHPRFPARFSRSFSRALRSFACFGAEFWFAPGVNFFCSVWSLWWPWSQFYDIHESKSAPLYNHLNVFLPTVINLHTNRCVRTIGKVRWQHAEGRVLLLLNPFTSKISLETLLTVCNTVLMLLVWRIWYWIS